MYPMTKANSLFFWSPISLFYRWWSGVNYEQQVARVMNNVTKTSVVCAILQTTYNVFHSDLSFLYNLLIMSKRGINIILMCIQVHMPSKLKFCKGDVCGGGKRPNKKILQHRERRRKKPKNHNPLISMAVAVMTVASLFGCNVVLEVW